MAECAALERARLLEEVLQVLDLTLERLELREALLVLPLFLLEHLLEALLLLREQACARHVPGTQRACAHVSVTARVVP